MEIAETKSGERERRKEKERRQQQKKTTTIASAHFHILALFYAHSLSLFYYFSTKLTGEFANSTVSCLIQSRAQFQCRPTTVPLGWAVLLTKVQNKQRHK